MPDHYDVLPIPVSFSGIVDKAGQVIKPFIGIYFPAELLIKIKWNAGTGLTLSVEEEDLKISRTADGHADYFSDIRRVDLRVSRR